MADSKKYYYMRLKEGYFDSDEQKILERMPDGYLYSNILLKLYLKSLKNNGKLMLTDSIPYDAQMIATVTGHQVGTVKQALQIFEQLGIIKRFETGEIYMMDIQNFVGESSTEADRVRNFRKQVKDKETKLLNGVQMYDNRTPEIEIEKEIETEQEKDIRDRDRMNERGDTASAPTPAKRHQYGMYHNVLFTDEEFAKLQEEFPDWEQRVERLSEYIASKGAKYKNHLATIRAWARKDKERPDKPKEQNPALNYAQRTYDEHAFDDIFEDLN